MTLCGFSKPGRESEESVDGSATRRCHSMVCRIAVVSVSKSPSVIERSPRIRSHCFAVSSGA
jgi:hypothetical protein